MLSGTLAGLGCNVDRTPGSEDAGAVGHLSLPMQTSVGEHTYVLTDVSLWIAPSGTYSSSSPSDEALSIALNPGEYVAQLQSWALNRKLKGGRLERVDSVLLSAAEVPFTIQNGATTTLSFQFETDGQIITIGAGDLRVIAEVTEAEPVCSPLGEGCDEGFYCAPTELTGKPLACIPHGELAVGEGCSSPSECGANSTCLRFGGGEARCAALCESSQFDEPCESGGVCSARGEDYGACTPEREPGTSCILSPVLLSQFSSVDSVTVDDNCTTYVAASDGLYAADLWTGLTKLIMPASALGGIDLSPSGTTLVTAETWSYTYNPRSIHFLERASGTQSALSLALSYYSGLRNVVFQDESSLWLSTVGSWSSYSDVGTLSGSTGDYSAKLSLSGSAMFATAGSRERTFVASTGGVLAALDRQGLVSANTTLSHSIAAIAAHSSGSRVFAASSSGLESYSLAGTFTRSWSIPGSFAGVAYVAESDQLVVSRTGGPLELRSPIDGALIRVLDTDPGVGFGAAPFGPGYLRASRGGGLVSLNTDSGIRFYPLGG